MTFLTLFAFAVGMTMAQSMYVHKTDGNVYEFKVSDADNVELASPPTDDHYFYTITYMPNGGKGAMVVDTVFYGESYTIRWFVDIKKEGYCYTWNTDPDGHGTDFYFGRTINAVSRNITLYAHWKYQVTGIENGYTWEDLGLPSGTKWATCNVGASAPEEYGDYYAWGETTTKSTYEWSTYKWCNGSFATLTKYNTSSSSGTVDNKTVLELADDAARANWGGAWRMPTDAEWTELRDNCAWAWTDNYNGTGVAGRIVTSNINGNSIFLPAAGYRYDDVLYGAGSYGRYWSGSLYTDYPGYAWYVNFDSDNVNRNSDFFGDRYYGRSVRPVLSPPTP